MKARQTRGMWCALVEFFLSTLAVAAQETDAAKAELKKMAGTWEVVSVDFGGRDVYAEMKEVYAEMKKEMPQPLIVIAGGKLKAASQEAEAYAFALVVDPGKKPKAVDLTWPGRETPTYLAIYELRGDELRVCIPLDFGNNPRHRERSTSFETMDKSVVMVTFKRIPDKK